MMKTLKFIVRSQIKSSKVVQQPSGFTLIELLVGVVMAFLIITPLLGFMLNVMNTDRNEQAKATSEQEIQAGLDYIARDLKQAVYIYDATGINAITTQIPTSTDRVPVLVFWKRELVPQVIANSSGTGQDDTFVYSLVVYYLIKDTTTITNWSQAARIGRWEIRDGVVTSSTDTSNSTTCTGYTSRYVKGSNGKLYCPDPGFAPFDLTLGGNLTASMNSWTKAAATYTANTVVLVDYIDQTTTGAPAATCPPNSTTTTPAITWSKVTPTSFNTQDTGNMTGFYACVDTLNTTAQLFIRGNARARIDTNNFTYSDAGQTYFPTANIRVQGRGYLYK